MLDPTIFDRFTMGFALGVHIILAVIGIVLPVMILIADYLWIKHGDRYYRALSKRLSTALIVLFAVGTASGILVAINLLVLWPAFMALVSKVAILPVYIEVFAFFTESIFLTIYIVYRDSFRNKNVRLFLMLMVAIGAAMSGVLITVFNSFMNTPVGFNIAAFNITSFLQNGSTLTDLNPVAVFTAPAVGIEVSHMLATTYFAGASIFLAYFAYMLLKTTDEKKRTYYKKALKLTFAIVLIAIVLSIITGILSIETLYHIQPEKYAAIELDLRNISFAPEIIGGIYMNGVVQYGIAIPDLQSMLATGSPSGFVPGLNQFPQWTWPPLIVHDMFDFMFGLGVLQGLFAFVILVLYIATIPILYNIPIVYDIIKFLETNLHIYMHDIFEDKTALLLMIISGILAVVMLEDGWLVDELGRQPWIIYNVMTVTQAGNQSTSIIPIAALIVIIYIVIIPLTYFVIKKIFSKRDLKKEL